MSAWRRSRGGNVFTSSFYQKIKLAAEEEEKERGRELGRRHKEEADKVKQEVEVKTRKKG